MLPPNARQRERGICGMRGLEAPRSGGKKQSARCAVAADNAMPHIRISLVEELIAALADNSNDLETRKRVGQAQRVLN